MQREPKNGFSNFWIIIKSKHLLDLFNFCFSFCYFLCHVNQFVLLQHIYITKYGITSSWILVSVLSIIYVSKVWYLSYKDTFSNCVSSVILHTPNQVSLSNHRLHLRRSQNLSFQFPFYQFRYQDFGADLHHYHCHLDWTQSFMPSQHERSFQNH